MLNVPIPKRLTLFAARSYIVKCVGESPLVYAAFYDALRNGALVAEGNFVAWKGWRGNQIIGNLQSIPPEVWQKNSDIDFNHRIEYIEKIEAIEKNGNDGAHYLNPTIATADINSWLGSGDIIPSTGKLPSLNDKKSKHKAMEIEETPKKPFKGKSGAKTKYPDEAFITMRTLINKGVADSITAAAKRVAPDYKGQSSESTVSRLVQTYSNRISKIPD